MLIKMYYVSYKTYLLMQISCILTAPLIYLLVILGKWGAFTTNHLTPTQLHPPTLYPINVDVLISSTHLLPIREWDYGPAVLLNGGVFVLLCSIRLTAFLNYE